MIRPNIISRLLESVAALGLLGIVSILLLQLIARTFSLGSFSWTDELARYLMISLVFLAAPAVLESDQHIKVEFFVDRLPPTFRSVVVAIGSLLVAIFAAFLTFSAVDLTLQLWTSRTPALRMPMPAFFGGALFGSAILVLAGLRKTFDATRRVFSKERSHP